MDFHTTHPHFIPLGGDYMRIAIGLSTKKYRERQKEEMGWRGL
jgi:hypothetical protein